jgi:phosphoribosylglycinamide formyltransferase-1
MRPDSAPTRVAVLASGGGTNLAALLAHLDALGDRRRGEVVAVLSDRRSSGALARARERRLPGLHIDPRDGGASLERALGDHDVELVVLAGYLRLVPAAVTRRFRGRMLNVHPALLPAFGGPGMYGHRVHQAVLDAGARVSGVTVHFVDEEFDRGAIVAQWPVPVFDEDDADTLAARVLQVEHALYPRVVDAVAGEAIALDDDGRVRGAFLAGPQGEHFALARDISPGILASQIEMALAR